MSSTLWAAVIANKLFDFLIASVRKADRMRCSNDSVITSVSDHDINVKHTDPNIGSLAARDLTTAG